MRPICEHRHKDGVRCTRFARKSGYCKRHEHDPSACGYGVCYGAED
jgi:hypothetical protein